MRRPLAALAVAGVGALTAWAPMASAATSFNQATFTGLALCLRRPFSTGRVLAVLGCFAMALLSKEQGVPRPSALRQAIHAPSLNWRAQFYQNRLLDGGGTPG